MERFECVHLDGVSVRRLWQFEFVDLLLGQYPAV